MLETQNLGLPSLLMMLISTSGGVTRISTLGLEEKLKKLEENNVNNGAILVLDTDSNQVLIWIGSKDYFDESIDGAVDMLLALRQPGSALKPFTYLKAFLKGYTPATTVNDIYTQFSTCRQFE